VFCARFERGTFRSQTLQLAPNCSALTYWVSPSSVQGISQWLPCSDATTFHSLIDFSFPSIQWTLSPPSKLEIMMNPFREGGRRRGPVHVEFTASNVYGMEGLLDKKAMCLAGTRPIWLSTSPLYRLPVYQGCTYISYSHSVFVYLHP